VNDLTGPTPVGTTEYVHPAPAGDVHAVSVSIDGVRHELSVESRESLWETLVYRLGHGGANLGCDRAQCGICNVVLDGRSVNSCAVLTARLSGKSITTVSGLSSGPKVSDLHPLQRAFWEEGAFQCGICTKGFLMTSHALLEKNPDPTDDEILAALSGVLCRCGEQARIVLAVKRAALEMRTGAVVAPEGSLPHTSETSLMPHTSEVIGARIPRIHGMGSVTDEGQYLSLMTVPGMVFVRMLRSPYPRARIVSVDTRAAEQVPGVVAVVHHFNMPEPYASTVIEGPPYRYLLGRDLVQVGMPVAVVAAESEHIADDALALIEVEYEVLEPTLDYLNTATAAPQWDNHLPGTIRNVIPPVVVGEPDRALEHADVLIENVTTTPYEQHVPLELRTGLYFWEGDNLVTYQTTHRTFDARRELARWLNLELDQVRLIQTGFMGSSYGSADHLIEEVVLPAVLSKITGRPVRSTLTREESFLTSAHRGRTWTKVKMGVNRDGVIQGVAVDVVYDGGTNAGTPASAAASPGLSGVGVRGGWYVFQILYSYLSQKYEGMEVWTNSLRAGPMRGVGRMFGLFALETTMEKAAYGIGMDPLAFRLRNLNETGAVFDEISGTQPGLPFGRVGGQRASLERAAELIEWADLWRPPRGREVRPGVFRGLGIVSTLDRGGGRQGGAPSDAPPPPSTAQVFLYPDGTLEVLSGSTEVGSGQRTLMAMIAAQVTGITLDRVVINPGVDTGINTDTGPTNSSLQTNVSGWAVLEASELLKSALVDHAARAMTDLGFDPAHEALDVRDGWVFVTDRDEVRCSVDDVVANLSEPLHAESDRRRKLTEESVAVGAHAVEVEVDTATGGIEIVRYVAVHDVGKALNRMALDQQVEGGIVMGIGGALHEELIVDEVTGILVNPNILDYKVPSLYEVPPFIVDLVEIPQDYGPFGAVAIGQASTPPVAPVLANALYNAVGVWVTDLPLSRNRVLDALGGRA
jgi:CO/xanthine dehydrogenase Mo-binding subunit/aerobic-type carbon monoxide dehydrogenase small subunit (CoxS/CutS family)